MADAEGASSGEEKKSGGSNKLLLIVLIVLLFVILVVGVGVVFVLMGSNNETSSKTSEHGEQVEADDYKEAGGHGGGGGGGGGGGIFPLDTFIVNLKVKGSFLKTDIQLVFSEPEIPEGFDNEIPRIRDVVILITTSKTAAEVLTLEGKEQLREEIRSGINEVLGRNDVEHVLFTEFIVQ